MRHAGFSLLELLVVIAIVGILGAIAAVAYPRDRVQVDQAVERLTRSIEKARFDAIHLNKFIEVLIDQDAQLATVTDVDGARVLTRISFGSDEQAQVTLRVEDATAIRLAFDARGMGRGVELDSSITADGTATVALIHDRTGFERSIDFNQYGLSEVQ